MRGAPPISRYAGRRSGWLMLVTIAIFLLAVLQAGIFQDLFKSVERLRILLPDTGLSGLEVDSEVEILGTRAGRVVAITIDPSEKFYATVEIDKAMAPFVRADSQVFIRRQFGIAGAAYLEITRGHGRALDWDYAVLQVTTRADAAESVDSMIADIRAQVRPILENADRAIAALANLAERVGQPGGDVDRIVTDIGTVSDRLAKGEGSIGRLIADDTLAREAEAAVASINAQMTQIDAILKDLRSASGDMAKVTGAVGQESQHLAAAIRNTNKTLISLNGVLEQIGDTMPQVNQLVANTSTATEALPTFLAQTELTLAELEVLLQQLQGSWLFGGGSAPPPPAVSVTPLDIRQ